MTERWIEWWILKKTGLARWSKCSNTSKCNVCLGPMNANHIHRIKGYSYRTSSDFQGELGWKWTTRQWTTLKLPPNTHVGESERETILTVNLVFTRLITEMINSISISTFSTDIESTKTATRLDARKVAFQWEKQGIQSVCGKGWFDSYACVAAT